MTGGRGQSNFRVTTFSWASGTGWVPRASLPQPRFSAASAGHGSAFFVLGGYCDTCSPRVLQTVIALDRPDAAWRTVATMSAPRWGFSAVVIGAGSCVRPDMAAGCGLC